MSNVIPTCSLLAKETLAVIKNMIKFAGAVSRDYESEFTGNAARGYMPGQTINIKKPPRYTYRAGRVAVPQASTVTSIPITLQQGGTEFNFNSLEMTLTLSKFERTVEAAAAAVVNEIDRQGLAMARLSTYNAIGTPGTLPTTQALALAAVTGLNQRLDEMGCPRDNQRTLIMNPAMNGAAVQGFAGLFNGQATLEKQFRRGVMVDSLGLAYAMSQNVDVHTNGTAVVATNTVNGANQSGSTITVAALNGTVTRGTKVTFAGCFAVNPQSRMTTATLAQFVVTADAAGAATSLLISPAIVTSGAFQNVTASPTNAGVITIFGTASGSYAANVAYHQDAFTLAVVPMWSPGENGVVDSSSVESDGFSLRVIKVYDGVNDNVITRLDVLFGWAAPYPELACIYGA